MAALIIIKLYLNYYVNMGFFIKGIKQLPIINLLIV